MASEMERIEKKNTFGVSISSNKTAVTSSVNTLKSIKSAIEAKKEDMEGDADFSVDDVAVATNALNQMHTLVKSIFGD